MTGNSTQSTHEKHTEFASRFSDPRRLQYIQKLPRPAVSLLEEPAFTRRKRCEANFHLDAGSLETYEAWHRLLSDLCSFVPQKACFSPYCNLSVTRRVCAMLCFVFARSMRRRCVSFVCASRWYGSVTLCMAVHTCYLSFFVFDLVCRNCVKNWHASSSIWPFSVSSLFRQQSATLSVLLLQMAVKSSRSSVSRPPPSGQLCGWMAPLLWSVRGSNLLSKAMEEPERNEHVLV